MAEKIAIIGGTGLDNFKELINCREEMVSTPFGYPSSVLTHGELSGRSVVFLPRHGSQHNIAPHRINYRANLWALNKLGVRYVIAVAAVGGIHAQIVPQRLCIPDQIIDYTTCRKNTFFEDSQTEVMHIDFTQPYCESLRQKLIKAAQQTDLNVFEGGVYGAMQGPRLETAAEIDRLQRDGCDIVGMTGMPEASLARELGLCYATCAVCANMAAGRGGEPLTMEQIEAELSQGMRKVSLLINKVLLLI